MVEKVRAKVKVVSLTEFPEVISDENPKRGEIVKFAAVCGNFDAEGNDKDENNTFAKWTPSFNSDMQVNNPAIWGFYQFGKEYYVDFVPVG